VVGDLRVLVNRTGEGQLYWSAEVVWRSLFGQSWELTVTPVDSEDVLARRPFRRRSAARRARDEFARLAGAQHLDRTDLAGIARLLGA
jgi:hypothetical protein